MITINTNIVSELAMTLVVENATSYIQNFYDERARVATEQAIATHVQACLANGWPVPQDTLAILQDGIARGTIKTAATLRQEDENAVQP